MTRALILIAFLIAATLMAAGSRHGISQTPTSVTVVPVTSTVATGDSAVVEVWTDLASESLKEWSLRLHYDPDVVVAAHCEFSNPNRLPSSCNVDYATSVVGIDGIITTPATGTGLLASIRFAAVGTSGAGSSLNLEAAKYSDPGGNPLNPSTTGGMINIQGTGALGIVRGTIFEDSHEDGALDAGEPGLALRQIALTGIDSLSSYLSGRYIIPDVLPGQYAISTELDQETVPGCAEGDPSFDPLLQGGFCFGDRDLFEPTTPETSQVDIAAGSATTVDFGGRRLDLQYVAGEVIIEDNYAPPGTRVEASHNGQVCGSSAVTPYGFGGFYVEIKGARELPGCAAEGEAVNFTVNGVPANQDLVWQGRGEVQALDLTVMPNHSWYWLQKPANGNVSFVGSKVEAIVGDVVCGSTTIEQARPGFSLGPPPVGFYRLIVPRSSLLSGCGAQGLSVRFVIGGQGTGVSLPWQTGVQRVDFPFIASAPTATPTPLGPVRLPNSGGSAPTGELAWPVAVVGLVLVFGFGVSRHMSRRR